MAHPGRARERRFRNVGVACRAAMIALALVGAGCTGKYVRPTTPERIQATPEMVARGKYLVDVVCACGACHTPRENDDWLAGERGDQYMAGGSVFDDVNVTFKLRAPNITPDPETGVGKWSDDELMRALRDGVGRDGKLLYPPMPFGPYRDMSDDDARAVVSYLRTIPPIKHAVDRSRDGVGTMVKIAVKMGMMHHEPSQKISTPPATDRAVWGRYLVTLGACNDCHGLTSTGPSWDDDDYLAGAAMPIEERGTGVKVWPSNLTPDPETGLGKYSAEQIKASLRSGRRLDGKLMAHPMSTYMPHLMGMTEEDLDALVAHLKSLKPVKRKVPPRELTGRAKPRFEP